MQMIHEIRPRNKFLNKKHMENENSQTTDKVLHQKFVQLGNDRRKLTNQLLALLPEIYARGIFKKYARTIEEYAGKFGGLSKGVVQKRLRLEKYIYNKPNLKEAIVSEGVHKVALVASLATIEDEAAWADKLKNMSKPAVQELSKEVRYKMGKGEINPGGDVNMNLFDNEKANCKTTPCSAAPQRVRIDLEGELYFLFLKLKKKYGENLPAGQAGLSNQEIMKKVFENNLAADEQVKNGKTEQPQSVKVIHKGCFAIPGDSFAGKNLHEKLKDLNGDNKITKEIKTSRYIRVNIRQNLLRKINGKCSYPGCNRLAQIFHHTDRFANSHSHESIRPVCKIHHEFAHNGLIKNEKLEVREWQLQLQTSELNQIDRLYRQYRKKN